jgi:hypothetical protein
VADRLHLRLDLTELEGNDLALELMNLSGQRVFTWPITNNHGVQAVDLDAHGVASGAYFLRLRSEAGLVAVEKALFLGN